MNYTLFKEKIDIYDFSQNYIVEGSETFLDKVSKELTLKVLNPEEDFKISREIEEQTHPDLMIVESERNNISIDSIREMIKYVQKRPLEGKYKLVIIKGGQFLRAESSNALLKTLEESFDYVIICILVDSRYKLLSTIRSRCIFISEVNSSENFDYSDYGKLLEILIVTLVTYLIFLIFGLNYPLLLAFAVGLSVLVPYIGAVLVTIPVALVALFQFGISPTFWYIIIAFAISQLLDGNLLVPYLFSEAVNLHPLIIIISVLIFGGLWGFWGVFFAIPLATLVKAVVNALPQD